MTLHPAATPIRHGYTPRMLDRLARRAVLMDRWPVADADERHDAVLHAITVEVLTADARPDPRHLVRLGLRASNRHIEQELRHRGWTTADGAGSAPGFLRYWQATGRTPWDERLIEQLALAQIWPHLTQLQRQALAVLAELGDYQAAAEALGITRVALAERLRLGRRTVAALWHEHETPRRRRRDKRLLTRRSTWRGRRLLTTADIERLRDRLADGATYRQLAAETGYSAGALCNLIRGKRRPAQTDDQAALWALTA